MAIVYIVVVVVLPSLTLLVASTRRFLFIRNVPALFDFKQYGLTHFNLLFDNPVTLMSILNSVKVGFLAAACGGVLAFAIGYTVTRTRTPGRYVIDAIATVPVAIPGLVIGVAYLWAWISMPGGLYGTLWILALAFVARFIPDTVKALSSSLLQIHRELEEASWICGPGMLRTLLAIVIPLASPGVIAATTLLFTLSIRELGSSLFLYSSDTMVMAVHLLNFYEGGNLGVTAAFSVVQMVLLGGLIAAANWLARGKAVGALARAR
jgi:iron(III) transport system permease protein